MKVVKGVSLFLNKRILMAKFVDFYLKSRNLIQVLKIGCTNGLGNSIVSVNYPDYSEPIIKSQMPEWGTIQQTTVEPPIHPV